MSWMATTVAWNGCTEDLLILSLTRVMDNRERKQRVKRTIALIANSLIALIALGARFLKLTPCT